MRNVWCPVLALFLVSPLVSAEIFKCSDAKGNAKYQNFPCQIDSIGSAATAVAPKEQAAIPTTRVEPVRATPAKSPSVAQTATPKARGEPDIGMTTDQVRALLGEPTRTEVTDFDGFETWYYDLKHGDVRTLRFDKTGRVLLVAEQD
jgi:hypothetical protein